MRDLTRAFCAIAIVASSYSAQSATTYEITSLGFLEPLFQQSGARGINNAGQVVGSSTNASGLTEAFFWDPSTGTMTGLGFLTNSTNSQAQAINDSGVVVGRSMSDAILPADGEGEAFRWTSGGGIMSLGTTHPDSLFSDAQDINSANQVAGTSVYDNTANPADGSGSQPSRWTSPTGFENLGNLTGSNATGGGNANGINDTGKIVGTSTTTTGPHTQEAFIWDPSSGTMTGLGFLEPATPDSSANDINNGDHVVGSSTNSAGVMEATLWLGGSGASSPLGFLDPTDTGSSAFAINDAGVIVGSSTNSSFFGIPTPLATIWNGSGPQYLGSLLDDPEDWLALATAFDINDAGQIVGDGIKSCGIGCFYFEAFLLTPSAIPIPPAFVLMLSACGLLVCRKRTA